MLDRADYTHPSPRLPHWPHARRGSVRDRDDPVAMLDGAETPALALGYRVDTVLDKELCKIEITIKGH